MKFRTLLFIIAASFASTAPAATINWSASVNHGFSLENLDALPVGSLVRLGWFRDPTSGQQLTDSQIQALKKTPLELDSRFVEAGRTTIGAGFDPAVAGHFAAVNIVDTSETGLNLAGKQMYIWVLNAATVGAATEQAILYWNIADTTSNPDGMADKPGNSWRFPTEAAYPVSTTIDINDLTIGAGGPLASGARLVVGKYPNGTSPTTGISNFGLSALDQPLDVVTPSMIAGGSVGVRYDQKLTAVEGSLEYKWYLIGGKLPNGLSMNIDGEIYGLPTFAGIYDFIVQAVDGVSSPVSRSITIVIASTPLVITTNSELSDAGLDAFYSVQLISKGGTGPYEWTLIDGTLPNGMTLDEDGLLTGTPTAAGVNEFTIECADAGGLKVEQTFRLNVRAVEIVSNATLNNAFLNVPFSQALIARGGKGAYTWSLKSGALPDGMNLSSLGVLSFTPGATGTSSFTLEVKDQNDATATQTFTLNVLGLLAVPEVNTPSFDPVDVGEEFYYQLTASNYAKKFSAKGLPSGLKLNAVTGEIRGRPKIAGQFSVKITASNEAGTGPILTAGLQVGALPEGVVGTFLGSVAHNISMNGNLGGRIDLTTTKVGGYTIKLTQGGKVSTFSGAMTVVRNQTPKIEAISKGVEVELMFDVANDLLTGTVTNLSNGSSASIAGWRHVWNKATKPASTREGYYSMGIEIDDNTATPGMPEGSGFARCVVGLDGKLKITGKTADGNAVTTAGFIGPNGEALLYQVLYGKLGSLAGRLTIVEDENGLYYDNVITGILTWLKPPTKTRIYPAGFGPFSMDVYGKYLARDSNFWGLTGMPNPAGSAALKFFGGGLSSAAIDPSVAAFTFTNAGKVVMPLAGGVDNPGRTSLVIPFSAAPTATNGMIRGSFRLIDGLLVRNVKYEGMIIRAPNSTDKACGFFLLPQIPTGSEKPKTSPILSGQVTITQ